MRSILHLLPMNALILIHLFFFYLNFWTFDTYWIPKSFSDHIMDGKKIDFMILVIFWRKQPVVSPSLPLLCLHSRMVGHGRSMTRTSSLVRLCRTSLARASMNPSRVKSMVGDSRSCISQGIPTWSTTLDTVDETCATESREVTTIRWGRAQLLWNWQTLSTCKATDIDDFQ